MWPQRQWRLNPHDPFFYSYVLGHAYRLTDRHEKAVAEQKRALVNNPGFIPAHIELVVTYSELGREEEARAEMAIIQKYMPMFSTASQEMVKLKIPYKYQTDTESFLAALSKTGLN